MTIKEMIKKVETYNEIQNVFGDTKIEMRMTVGYSLSVKVNSVAELKKHMKREYVEEFAKAVMDFDGWNFNESTEIECECFGSKYAEKVEFSIGTAW